MPRIDDVFYNQIDDFSNEAFTISKVTTFVDGSTMDDSKVDEVIFLKKGSEYFKRNFESGINIKWFGASVNIANNTTPILLAIFLAKKIRDASSYRGQPLKILVPSGTFKCSGIINLPLALTLEGVSPNDSILLWENKFSGGVKIDEPDAPTELGHLYTNIRNLSILGGSYLENPFAYKDFSINYPNANGIDIRSSRVRVNNCVVDGWNNHGIYAASVYYVFIDKMYISNNKIGYQITNTSTSNFLTASEVRFNSVGIVLSSNSYGNYIKGNIIESNISNFMDDEPDSYSLMSKGKAVVLDTVNSNYINNNYIEAHVSTFALSNSDNNFFANNVIVPQGESSLSDGLPDIVTYYTIAKNNRFENNTLLFGNPDTKANIRIIDISKDYSKEFYQFDRDSFSKIIADNLTKWHTVQGLYERTPIIQDSTESGNIGVKMFSLDRSTFWKMKPEFFGTNPDLFFSNQEGIKVTFNKNGNIGVRKTTPAAGVHVIAFGDEPGLLINSTQSAGVPHISLTTAHTANEERPFIEAAHEGTGSKIVVFLVTEDGHIKTSGGIEVTDFNKGIKLYSENGSSHVLKLNDDGTLNVPGGTGLGPVVNQLHESGSTVTISNDTDILYVDPATTLAALTITLPATPTKPVQISFGGQITSGPVVTSLNIAPNTSQSIIQIEAPNAAEAGESISYTWRGTPTNKWYLKF